MSRPRSGDRQTRQTGPLRSAGNRGDHLTDALSGTARRREGLPDTGAVSSGGEKQVQQEAGLERRQVSGADQPPGQQVRFGAGKP